MVARRSLLLSLLCSPTHVVAALVLLGCPRLAASQFNLKHVTGVLTSQPSVQKALQDFDVKHAAEQLVENPAKAASVATTEVVDRSQAVAQGGAGTSSESAETLLAAPAPVAASLEDAVKQHSELQAIASGGLSGALKTTPTDAVEVVRNSEGGDANVSDALGSDRTHRVVEALSGTTPKEAVDLLKAHGMLDKVSHVAHSLHAAGGGAAGIRVPPWDKLQGASPQSVAEAIQAQAAKLNLTHTLHDLPSAVEAAADSVSSSGKLHALAHRQPDSNSDVTHQSVEVTSVQEVGQSSTGSSGLVVLFGLLGLVLVCLGLRAAFFHITKPRRIGMPILTDVENELHEGVPVVRDAWPCGTEAREVFHAQDGHEGGFQRF